MDRPQAGLNRPQAGLNPHTITAMVLASALLFAESMWILIWFIG